MARGTLTTRTQGTSDSVQMLLSWSIRAVLLAALFPCVALGDETVRRVQEELRKRYLYFGEIDAKFSPEVVSAIRRYQQRKGFSTSGSVDAELLASLGVTAPVLGAGETLWPEEVVLRSDHSVAAKVADQASPANPEAVEPADIFTGSPALENEPPAIVAQPPIDSAQKGKPGAPPAVDAPAPAVPASAPANTLVQEAKAAIVAYLKAAEDREPGSEMSYYAATVDYFAHDVVDQQFIERDVNAYRRRWPNREYTLVRIAAVPMQAGEKSEVEVRFRIKFRVSNDSKKAAGQTDNIFRLRKEGDAFKLTFLRERRVRG